MVEIAEDRALDMWVAEHVMGLPQHEWEEVSPPHVLMGKAARCKEIVGGGGHLCSPTNMPDFLVKYSTTGNGMDSVLKEMRRRGYWGAITWPSGDSWRVQMFRFVAGTSRVSSEIPYATAPSLPLAVSLAAKAAIEDESSAHD